MSQASGLGGSRHEPVAPPRAADLWMPIIGTLFGVQMSVLNEQQADRNHGQTLRRLAERGGLSLSEAAAIAEQRQWRSQKNVDAAAAIQAVAPLVEPRPERDIDSMEHRLYCRGWNDALAAVAKGHA